MSDGVADRTAKRAALLETARRHQNYGAGPAGPGRGPALTLALPVTLPDGKEGWVHPCSLEQAFWLNLRAAKAVKRLNLADEDEIRAANLYYAQVFQFLEAVRESEAPDAPPLYPPEHAETIWRARGWLAVVRQVCYLSDQLNDEGLTRDAFADFFDAWAQRLETWSSRLSMDSLESCRKDLAALASFASLTKQRKSLSVGEMPALPELVAPDAEPDAEPEPEPDPDKEPAPRRRPAPDAAPLSLLRAARELPA